jgi:hypothetical protein
MARHGSGQWRNAREPLPARKSKPPLLLPVECGGCGWKGRRKAGQVVECPVCREFASFQDDENTNQLERRYP